MIENLPKIRLAHERRVSEKEKEYFHLVNTLFRILSTFYDIMFALLSLSSPRLRDEVADLANAGKHSRILDVATGTGKQAFAFAKKGHDVIGIDLSEDMLKVASRGKKFETAKFEVADASTLPLRKTASMFAVCHLPYMT